MYVLCFIRSRRKFPPKDAEVIQSLQNHEKHMSRRAIFVVVSFVVGGEGSCSGAHWQLQNTAPALEVVVAAAVREKA